MSDEVLSGAGQARRTAAFGVTLNAIRFSPLTALWAQPAHAGTQIEEPLANSVRSALAAAVRDSAPPQPTFATMTERLVYLRWLGDMSGRLRKRESDHLRRVEFFQTVWYEGTRAGLDPALLLGLIQVESG